ncbi:hypothetical protein COB21_01400 [Candidatus Aerophobetes bacterium]|uniref:Uncharacterized protein n=1 Tax=Aerophobetes bacterium TaxID=2030807 RepID=A0A2A4X761_UNCAE|nr:MAG: hypothetical protein COB21_01400 [Candidatus Aerophobetes bacterium]
MFLRVLIGCVFLIRTASFTDFDIDPYFHKLAEFNFTPQVGGRLYDNVSHLKSEKKYSSKDVLVDFNLGVRCLPEVDVQAELDFSRTHRLNFGLQRVGAQARYQLLDDIGGDPVSLILGGQFFYVPTRNMRDVSSPYHGQTNLEAGVSVGKEWSLNLTYVARLWGFVGMGQANRGLPWIKSQLHLDTKCFLGRIFLYGKGYFGLGNTKEINLARFDNGYGNIEHRSVDLGIKYLAKIGVWGDLTLGYQYRIWAYAFPEKTTIFYLAYRYPFSVL